MSWWPIPDVAHDEMMVAGWGPYQSPHASSSDSVAGSVTVRTHGGVVLSTLLEPMWWCAVTGIGGSLSSLLKYGGPKAMVVHKQKVRLATHFYDSIVH
jgi:hypothetical protein